MQHWLLAELLSVDKFGDRMNKGDSTNTVVRVAEDLCTGRQQIPHSGHTHVFFAKDLSSVLESTPCVVRYVLFSPRTRVLIVQMHKILKVLCRAHPPGHRPNYVWY